VLVRNQHGTHRDRLLRLLKARANEWVPLPEVMTAAGAQYSARIHELRGLGYRIENLRQGDHSFFRLVVNRPAPAAETPPSDGLLFPMEARHRDDG
jgi:hypothetical protein